MCLEDADCSSGLICSSSSHTCVECLTNSDCPTGACNTNSNLCVTCAQNSDCSSGEVCDTTNGNCVACLSTADCSSGVCDTSSNTCVACLANSDCSAGQLCNTASNTCVLCLSDSDCSAGLQCIASEGICGTGTCTTNADCTVSGEECDASVGKCKIRCSNHPDCPTNGVCNFQGSVSGLPPYYCAGSLCTTDQHCPGSTCGPDSKCVI